jgi:hypothetical protein
VSAFHRHTGFAPEQVVLPHWVFGEAKTQVPGSFGSLSRLQVKPAAQADWP